MDPFRADLHCHSYYSDGSCSPKQLIDLAVEEGLSGLSITDHDTIEAYPEALEYAKEKGLLLLTGIEFSAAYHNDPVHILGYGFSLDNQVIRQLCVHHRERRQHRNEQILANLATLNIHISYDELLAQPIARKTIGRPHIALLLMQRGVVSSMKEAFDLYLGESKAAFAPGEPVSVEKTIQTIHQGGGKAIIAHPQLIKKSSTVRYLLTLPFDGLEGYYAKMAAEQEEPWIRIATEKKWLITGGSDYHGDVKPHNALGSSWVNQETFYALYR